MATRAKQRNDAARWDVVQAYADRKVGRRLAEARLKELGCTDEEVEMLLRHEEKDNDE